MHVALQLAHALLKRLALLPELVQMLTLGAQAGLRTLLRADRPREWEQEQRAAERAD
ncbi:MAG TPA: hypothetical protein VF166_12145 [Gemmatimonadaceae bacterium]